MKPIQLLLLSLLVAMGILYCNRLRPRWIGRAVLLALLALGAVLVSVPDLSTAMAHWLGVGRGVDLMFYLGFVAVGFMYLRLYTRQRHLEWQLTELVRTVAILDAEESATDATPRLAVGPANPQGEEPPRRLEAA